MLSPYVVASLFPAHRMALGAIGQIINSLGTLILLFLVDPILYRLMDNDELSENLQAYSYGRAFGFLIGSCLILYISFYFNDF